MQGQFEQELNGFMLEQMGCGKCAAEASTETIGSFLYHLPEYTQALESYPSADHSAIKNKLDELMADRGTLAREFHRRRYAS